jgi:ubiquinone/menaquinone biosynthesis C-methylase UbiE
MSKNTWDSNWEKSLIPDYHLELIRLIKRYSPGKKVLEVGFGTGGDLIELAKKNFSCFGIESSKVAYKNSLKKFPKSIKTIFGDAEELPWRDNSFNLIFHQGVLEHFKDPQKFLQEQYRVLSPGGILIIDVPHKWNIYTLFRIIKSYKGIWYGGWERSYSAQELKNLTKLYKFKIVKVYYRGIFPHRWGKFLFPEKIVRRTWAKNLITNSPISWAQILMRRIYDKSKFVQMISSYNIILVVRK